MSEQMPPLGIENDRQDIDPGFDAMDRANQLTDQLRSLYAGYINKLIEDGLTDQE